MDQSLDRTAGARISLYRSVLFVPASNEKALSKAPNLPADAFVLDLEDSVAPEQKAAARNATLEAIGLGAFADREVLVRVNPAPGDDFINDIDALAKAPPDGILVPKIACGSDIDKVIDRMETSGLADLPLWVMVETAGAILRLSELTAFASRLAGFFFGANDLARDLGLRPGDMTLPTLITAAGQTIVAARAARVRVIGPVYNDVKDTGGFAAAAATDAENGFDGKALIHPAQIDPANEAFSPTTDDIAEARGILEAYSLARKKGAGVALLDGKMIEELHVDTARRNLAIADEIARRRGG